MATYTTTPTGDSNLAVTVVDDDDLVVLNITPASVSITSDVTSVAGRSGDVVLTTSDVTEGTRLYYTDARADARIAAADTDDISEGTTNLYYTTARANTDFDTRLATKSTSDVAEGTNLYHTTARVNSAFDTRLATKTTSDVAEGTNLYYTDARADARAQLKIDALVDGAPGTLDTLNEIAAAINDDAAVYTTLNGLISTNATNIALKFNTADFNSTFDTRLATKDTDDVAEGTGNLYYTQARFNGAFGAKSTSDLSEGTNLYYTTARANTDFDTRLATKDTDDLSEGTTNLYYTTSRHNTDFDTKLAAADTDDVSEGTTNLYYTDARANSAIDARVTGTFIEGLDFDSDGGTY